MSGAAGVSAVGGLGCGGVAGLVARERGWLWLARERRIAVLERVVIEVCARPGGEGFHASVRGRAGVWGCGRSEDEAVGSVSRAHLGELVGGLAGEMGYGGVGEVVRSRGGEVGVEVVFLEGIYR